MRGGAAGMIVVLSLLLRFCLRCRSCVRHFVVVVGPLRSLRKCLSETCLTILGANCYRRGFWKHKKRTMNDENTMSLTFFLVFAAGYSVVAPGNAVCRWVFRLLRRRGGWRRNGRRRDGRRRSQHSHCSLLALHFGLHALLGLS